MPTNLTYDTVSAVLVLANARDINSLLGTDGS